MGVSTSFGETLMQFTALSKASTASSTRLTSVASDGTMIASVFSDSSVPSCAVNV